MLAQANLYQRLKGVFSILLTPFTPALTLDVSAIESNLHFLLGQGVHGFVIAGTYGEYVALTNDERRTLIKTAVDTVRGRVPVIACTAAGSTTEVIELTRFAADTGADAAMITPPYGMVEPMERDVLAHFEAIAREASIGLVLYNNPHITPSLSPVLLARLAQIEGYVGVKQGAVTIQEHAELISLTRGRLRVFSGSDQAMVASLALGADGVSSTNSNFIPHLMLRTYDAMENGDVDEARRCFEQWAEFRRFARTAGQPGCAKAAVELLGRPCGPVRPPLTSPSISEREELRGILSRMGLEVVGA